MAVVERKTFDNIFSIKDLKNSFKNISEYKLKNAMKQLLEENKIKKEIIKIKTYRAKI